MKTATKEVNFLKATFVRNLLKAKSEPLSTASTNIGWGKNRLGQYCRYQMKINSRDLELLADYLNQYPSDLINKHPTQAIIDKWKKAQVNKNNKRLELKSKDVEDDPIKSDLSNLLLTNLATTVNNQSNSIEEILNCVHAIQKDVRAIKDGMNAEIAKRNEMDDKRQNYLMSNLKDIKAFERKMALNRHFNG